MRSLRALRSKAATVVERGFASHRMERGKERMDFGRVHGGLDNSR